MNKSEKFEEVHCTDSAYEDLLNDVYGTVKICGMEYNSGYALKELDPVAFRCGVADEPIKYKCLSCEIVHDEEEEAVECYNSDEGTEEEADDE